MNHRIVALASAAVLSLGVAFAGDAAAQNAAAQSVPNTESGIKPLDLAPGAAEPTRGVVFFTAAINSDGTIASCFECVPANTKRLGVGQYQIDFGENVQAINGWSRWVQADTLTTGTVNAWCNTADRAGDPNAVWVNCQHSGGPGSQGNSAPVDVSFFLFVAR
jgi:hypothetical protein